MILSFTKHCSVTDPVESASSPGFPLEFFPTCISPMKAKIGKVDHALPCYNQSRHQLFRKFTLNKDYVIYSPKRTNRTNSSEKEECENNMCVRACLHGVGDPGLVGLVSFVFTLWGTQNKRNLPH